MEKSKDLDKEVGEFIFDHLGLLLRSIEPEEYKNPIELLSGSSIGQHCRHVLEFYKCLKDGIKEGLVDYESRVRDIELEENMSQSLELLKELDDHFKGEMNSTNKVQVIYVSGSEKYEMTSSVQRELAFVLEHAIHHLAIIKIAVKHSIPRIILPKEFGVAPSTLRYLATQHVHS